MYEIQDIIIKIVEWLINFYAFECLTRDLKCLLTHNFSKWFCSSATKCYTSQMMQNNLYASFRYVCLGNILQAPRLIPASLLTSPIRACQKSLIDNVRQKYIFVSDSGQKLFWHPPSPKKQLFKNSLFQLNNLHRKGLMCTCPSANWAFKWPSTYVTPLIFHADQRGMGPFF